MLRNIKNQNGFTLVETLVAISVFAIASVVVSSVFVNANNLQQNTASNQRLQNEGRYILEKLAREIRGRQIVYPINYPSLDEQYVRELSFKKDEFGDTLLIKFEKPIIPGGRNIYSLLYQITDSTGTPKSDFLNAEDVEVVDAKFYVQPTVQDDRTAEPLHNIQPRVTILLKLKNVGVSPRYQKELTLQTTISSKVYSR